MGPNLGVVELTLAMHYVFNAPTDHFVFDVSHQAYVHKLLTGRREQFHTIRTRRPKWIHVSHGKRARLLRSRTRWYRAFRSTWYGCRARQDRWERTRCCARRRCSIHLSRIYEALNNIAQSTKRMLVILNDNEWSIDKNVGAIASYLNKIVTSPKYDYLHDRAGRFVEKVGGKRALNMARKAEEVAKGILWPSVIFEELGLKYYGPIDGHDIATLIKTFEFLKTQDRPVLLHVLTQKGKGFEPALQKQKKFHGLGPYDPETGETAHRPPHLFRSIRGYAGETGEHE